MTIQRLDLLHVDLPLRSKIRHASHERTSSESLIVRVTLSDGFVGYGEGVPREYVTGETIESTFATISSYDVAGLIGRPDNYPSVVEKLERLEFPETASDPRGMMGNAARCALEMAVLDAYGRKFGQSLGDVIRYMPIPGVSLSARPTRVWYSGAVTAASARKELISAAKMWGYGFRQIKVKVGVSGQDDERRLQALRRVVFQGMDLRLDANEAWSAAEVVEKVRPLLRYHPSVLEQPVPHAEIDALADLRPQIGMPVMLDESLCGFPDAVRAVRSKTADYFNVRLSKCGGYLPTLKIIGLAKRSGIGVQLGCHPGETGILSAAGRHFASNVRGFRYKEGSYDRYLLERNVTVGNVNFGYGGIARPLKGPGLGVEIDPSSLESMTRDRREIHYD